MGLKWHKKELAKVDKEGKNILNLKKFKNLEEHKTDFGVEADWSFSATGHGKGPLDGLAGSAKR